MLGEELSHAMSRAPGALCQRGEGEETHAGSRRGRAFPQGGEGSNL